MMFLSNSLRNSVRIHHRSLASAISIRSVSKVVDSAANALQDLELHGATVAVGGFGLGGNPETLLQELANAPNASRLTVASLTAGVDGKGIGLLLESENKVKRLISSYVGENKHLEQAFFGGDLEMELTPQGTIAARLHAAGAGMPAFYTPTGAGTIYAQGGIPIRYKKGAPGEVEVASEPKETRVFDDGVEYVMEHALKTDLALVKAHKADTDGNLVFRGTSRNSNPESAMSAKMCIVEAETIVQPGELDPDEIHLPGVFVNRVIRAAINDKPIERTRLQDANSKSGGVIKGGRGRIMRRAAKEFKNGMYVNLGIGMPTMASNYIPEGVTIHLQAENGLMGVGPYPSTEAEADADFINAGKETITARAGSSSFSSFGSFNMIRGGHIDLTILGGLQCSANGDLASWIVPGKIVKGMGGAMDLVGAPGSKVVVTMDHTAKNDSPKIMQECSLPLTGRRVIDRIITDMGVFDCDKKGGSGLTLVEIAPGITIDDIRNATGCDFKVASGSLPLMDDLLDDEE